MDIAISTSVYTDVVIEHISRSIKPHLHVQCRPIFVLNIVADIQVYDISRDICI